LEQYLLFSLPTFQLPSIAMDKNSSVKIDKLFPVFISSSFINIYLQTENSRIEKEMRIEIEISRIRNVTQWKSNRDPGLISVVNLNFELY
jgi:hypothetical protein